MKLKNVNTWIILLFLLQLFFNIGVLLFSPKELISQGETRELSTFPALSLHNYITGGFAQGLDAYIDDHFAFRGSYLQVSKKLDTFYVQKEKKTEESLVVSSEKAIEALSPQEKSTPKIPNPILVKVGLQIVNNDRLVETYIFNEDVAQQYIDAINALYSQCNVPTYLMTPFSPAYYYTPKEFIGTANDQVLSQNYVREHLSGPMIVDTNSQLAPHLSENLFFKTDHHWTATGAYYASGAFLSQLGLQPLPLDSYESGIREGFRGTLYKAAKQSPKISLLDDVYDQVPYYIPKTKTTATKYKDPDMNDGMIIPLVDPGYNKDQNLYSLYLQGDAPIIHVKSDVPNGQTLLIVKDSYANSMIPFLADHFAEIYAVDPRYFNKEDKPDLVLSDFMEGKEIDMMLILNYNLFATSDYWMHFGDLYDKLLKK